METSDGCSIYNSLMPNPKGALEKLLQSEKGTLGIDYEREKEVLGCGVMQYLKFAKMTI